MITKQDLINDILAMGIQATDTVLIHTSMRAIGEVEGGADTVIDAFCECLSDGLFLVPTHTWAYVGRRAPVYDAGMTVPCIGALPRVAAQRSDGFRSLHPTHSIWGHGKEAERFLANEETAQTPCPPGYAWDRLADVGAKILLIGVGLDKNTFIHAIDEVADLPDRLVSDPYEVTIRDRQGNTYRHPFTGHFCSRSPDVSAQFVNFESPLRELGAMTDGKLGNAHVRIVDAAACKRIILGIYARATTDLCIERMEIPPHLYRT